MKQRFGLAIKNWRTKCGLSQEELAGRAGLHRSYIADVERGARNLSLESIEKLATGLQVSLSTLFQPLQAQAPEGALRDELVVDLLLVEDDPADAQLTVRAFQKAGVRNRVQVARDGEAALHMLLGPGAAAMSPRPRVVILDLHLPRESGLEVLRAIKSDERTRDIPVVVVAEAKDQRLVDAAKRLGAHACIGKPVDFCRLCDVILQLNCYCAVMMREEPVKSAAAGALNR